MRLHARMVGPEIHVYALLRSCYIRRLERKLPSSGTDKGHHHRHPYRPIYLWSMKTTSFDDTLVVGENDFVRRHARNAPPHAGKFLSLRSTHKLGTHRARGWHMPCATCRLSVPPRQP
uniref:Uncharacterized protein n=1 Tax=Fagus sylvatica TaxID=28930 RepID=A0A2N9F4A3_FAGSY